MSSPGHRRLWLRLWFPILWDSLSGCQPMCQRWRKPSGHRLPRRWWRTVACCLSFSSVAERRRRKTQERSFSTSPAGVLAAILWASILEFVAGCLSSSLLLGVYLCTPSVCLCGLLYEASYRSEIENLDYTKLLDDQIVFQRACNLMMYSTMV